MTITARKHVTLPLEFEGEAIGALYQTDAAGVLTPVRGSADGDLLAWDAATGTWLAGDAASRLPASFRYAAINAPLDNAGAVLDTSVAVEVIVHTAGTLIGWTVLSEVTGDVAIDVYHATYAAYPTFTKISATAPITIASGQQKNTSTALTGWTTAVVDGDVLKFVVTSATTITRAYVALKLQRG